mmetsp:Transcript_2208/g.4644  ORF Transcript_2208/g.4644 Transcript_2208/m.4644 type:complete len:91 (+) Transcript_2208:217-489(+)
MPSITAIVKFGSVLKDFIQNNKCLFLAWRAINPVTSRIGECNNCEVWVGFSKLLQPLITCTARAKRVYIVTRMNNYGALLFPRLILRLVV